MGAPDVVIYRRPSTDEGTFGIGRLVIPAMAWSCHSGELPWRENRQKVSCIPVGTYPVVWMYSPSFGRYTFRLVDVPGRTGVLIHPANYMGNIDAGLRAQLQGCIALGHRVGIMDGQRALLVSAPAVRQFEHMMQRKPFTLEIKDA